MIKIGISGYGKIGKVRANEVKKNKDTELVGVYDINRPQELDKDVPFFSTFDELLTQDLDAVFVCAFNNVTAEYTIRALKAEGCNNILAKTSVQVDLRIQASANELFEEERPTYVFLAVAKVGGIAANIEKPSEFLYDNVMINSNIINASFRHGVEKLLFLGSSCIYPRLSPQPMKEEYLLDGKLEPTNEGYALGKIIGIKLYEYYSRQYGLSFIAAMPPNLYGENDDFDPEKSHIVAALIRKFHFAKVNGDKEVVLWGTRMARREFMYVDDLASGCLFLMENYKKSNHINIGFGDDISILVLAEMIKKIVGYEGGIKLDKTKPDGMPRKLMDNSRMGDLGWRHATNLEEGIKRTYDWFLSQLKS